MSRPSLATFALGLWLGMLLASWAAATVNFRTVDRVLGAGVRPELASRLAGVPTEERRVVLRHLASEINRWMFRWWSLAQVGLGALLVALLWSAPAPRVLASAALLLALAQATALAGPITELGRSIDFVPRPLPPDVAGRFGRLHGAYLLTDLVKALLLVAAAWSSGRQPAA